MTLLKLRPGQLDLDLDLELNLDLDLDLGLNLDFDLALDLDLDLATEDYSIKQHGTQQGPFANNLNVRNPTALDCYLWEPK